MHYSVGCCQVDPRWPRRRSNARSCVAWQNSLCLSFTCFFRPPHNAIPQRDSGSSGSETELDRCPCHKVTRCHVSLFPLLQLCMCLGAQCCTEVHAAQVASSRQLRPKHLAGATSTIAPLQRPDFHRVPMRIGCHTSERIPPTSLAKLASIPGSVYSCSCHAYWLL